MPNFQSLRDIPILSELGFQKMPVPAAVFEKILTIYQLLKSTEKQESFEGKEHFIRSTSTAESSYLLPMDLYPAMREEILQDCGAIFQNWVNVPIQPLCIYGIRSYRHGAMLNPHVDRLQTHHVSAIVCVDKVVHDDWALDFCDHMGRWHEIFLVPGEMLLYESAICQHGRLKPFNGSFYNNLFIHYSLA